MSYPQNFQQGYPPQPYVPQGQQPYQPHPQHGAAGNIISQQGYPPSTQNNPYPANPNQYGNPAFGNASAPVNSSHANNATDASEYVDPKTGYKAI